MNGAVIAGACLRRKPQRDQVPGPPFAPGLSAARVAPEPFHCRFLLPLVTLLRPHVCAHVHPPCTHVHPTGCPASTAPIWPGCSWCTATCRCGARWRRWGRCSAPTSGARCVGNSAEVVVERRLVGLVMVVCTIPREPRVSYKHSQQSEEEPAGLPGRWGWWLRSRREVAARLGPWGRGNPPDGPHEYRSTCCVGLCARLTAPRSPDLVYRVVAPPQVEWVSRVEFLWDHIPKVRARSRARSALACYSRALRARHSDALSNRSPEPQQSARVGSTLVPPAVPRNGLLSTTSLGNHDCKPPSYMPSPTFSHLLHPSSRPPPASTLQLYLPTTSLLN